MLLFADGFDHMGEDYGTLIKWDSTNYPSRMEYKSGYGRTGGWGFYIWESDSYYKNFVSTETVIVGMAIRFQNYSSSNTPVQLLDGGTVQVSLRFDPDGSIKVLRGTTVILGSSASAICSAATWHYVELKVFFNQTVGTVEVRLNGTTVISLTGQDTVSTSNTYANVLGLKGMYSSGPCYTGFDDLYICDTTGTTNNDFLGDISVTTLYPVSDGTHSDFTPSTGTDHYALIDDPQLVDDLDYIESSTIGHKDTYPMTTFSGTGDVFAVVISTAVQNSDAGTMSIRGISRSGSVPIDNEGQDHYISQTLKSAEFYFPLEPTDGVLWTASKINASEFGLKVQS